MSSKQLYEKTSKGYNKIYPLAKMKDVFDDNNQVNMIETFKCYNHIYIGYTGDTKSTRLTVPEFLRRWGLWITYDKDGTFYTEAYIGTDANSNLDEVWSKDSNWQYIPDINYINDASLRIPNEAILPEHLSQSILDMIAKAGTTIHNLIDEEDLTEKNCHVIKFKDRKYNPAIASGKGYKILRKNWVDGKNILTQEMINDANTVYEIRYDFDLNGESITIPKGCILDFKGGNFNNGIINSVDTIINQYKFNCIVKGYIYDINKKRISNNGIFTYNTNVELQMSISDFSDNWMYENFEFLENIGISDVVLCPQLIFDKDYNISYRYNNAKFENITKIISKYNINIVGVKFHQQTGFDKTVQNETLAKNWANFLKQEIDKYASINTIKYVYIINENNDWATTGSIYIPYILKINDYIKSKRLISCISYINSYRLSLVDKQFSKIDVNALNYYPTLSFMDENASLNEVMINNIRKDINEYIYTAKTIFGNTVYGISETGTMNKVKSLRFPWETNLDNTGETSDTNIPLHIYYDAFFAGIQGINNLKFINLFFISPYNNKERQDILVNQLKKYSYVI